MKIPPALSAKTMLPVVKNYRMTEDDFRRATEYLYREIGLSLADSKRTMLEGRLQKRINATGFTSFKHYLDHVFSTGGKAELTHFIDLATTNKTDFLREPRHFDYLASTLLPAFTAAGNTHLKVWSAGCSTGEEPYTIAMFLEDHAMQHPGFGYSILATDICTKVLAAAENATYARRLADPLPLPMRKRYLLANKDEANPLVRIVPQLRRHVQLQQYNLMNTGTAPGPFDIVFCRNVIIYFDTATRHAVIRRLLGSLRPGGYLFLGMSESVINANLPIRQVAASVYQKTV